MPAGISFAWTSPAVVAGVKTCTRRAWSPKHARTYHAGDVVTAWDKQARFGGRPIATITLTADPAFSDDYPAADFRREGFAYLRGTGARVDGLTPDELWAQWRRGRPRLWVVRFVLHELLPAGEHLVARLAAGATERRS